MKFLEKYMEDLIIKNPQKYLNEPGLKLISRQYSVKNYRFDLLFEDRHEAKLIVEIQKGTLDRNHTYKIFDYYDEFKEQNPTEFVELMVVANRIPRERRNRLTSKGIAFKEIPESTFIEDANWQKINTEKKLDNSNIDFDSAKDSVEKGKQLFENLLKRNEWKEQSSKLTEMTLHRKKQLITILKIYGSLSIPFSHFTSKIINNASLKNSQIYPIICAYHMGYFDKTENSIILKENYRIEINQNFPGIISSNSFNAYVETKDDTLLFGVIRNLGQVANGWARREIAVKRQNTGFPMIGDRIKVYDSELISYNLSFIKGANKKGWSLIGQPGVLRPWFLKHYPKKFIKGEVLFELIRDSSNEYRIWTKEQWEKNTSKE